MLPQAFSTAPSPICTDEFWLSTVFSALDAPPATSPALNSSTFEVSVILSVARTKISFVDSALPRIAAQVSVFPAIVFTRNTPSFSAPMLFVSGTFAVIVRFDSAETFKLCTVFSFSVTPLAYTSESLPTYAFVTLPFVPLAAVAVTITAFPFTKLTVTPGTAPVAVTSAVPFARISTLSALTRLAPVT